MLMIYKSFLIFMDYQLIYIIQLNLNYYNHNHYLMNHRLQNQINHLLKYLMLYFQHIIIIQLKYISQF